MVDLIFMQNEIDIFAIYQIWTRQQIQVSLTSEGEQTAELHTSGAKRAETRRGGDKVMRAGHRLGGGVRGCSSGVV